MRVLLGGGLSGVLGFSRVGFKDLNMLSGITAVCGQLQVEVYWVVM